MPHRPVVKRRSGAARYGEQHERAKFSDVDVALIKRLHQDFDFSYSRIMWVFEARGIKISKASIQHICTGKRRGHRYAAGEALAEQANPLAQTPSQDEQERDDVLSMHAEGVSLVYISKVLKIDYKRVRDIIERNQ